jgi:hypothetical protein
LFAVIVVVLALIAGSQSGMGRALGQVEGAQSLAGRSASVVAQGVAGIPAGELAWRVTRASTPLAAGMPDRGGPGFILVDEGELLLNDVATETQTRLASGEADFVAAGARPQEVPLGQNPLAYYRIDLVAASEVNDANGDELLFVGQPFASPGGNRDIDLVRDVLGADESRELALGGQAAPVLLFVTAGAVELTPADDEAATPVRLPQGQGAGLGGNVIARASDGASASFVTVVIGPEVPPILAQEAAPAPSSLTVQARACPAGYAGTTYAVDCVEPLADIAFTLASAALGVSLDGTSGADGSVVFSDLTPETYTLTGGVPGEFAANAVECTNPAGPVAAEPSQTETPGAAITLGEGVAITCSWYVTPENLRGEDEGTIAISAHICPGMPIDPFTDCAAGDASGVVIDGPVALSTDAVSGATGQGDGASWVWGEEGGVPFGTYVLQPGGMAAPAGYEISEVRGATGGSDSGWAFTVDEAKPEVALAVIYVPAGQAQGDVDGDGDGLPDAREAEFGTDPARADSDGDGIVDGAEIAAGTNPTLADAVAAAGDNQEVVSGVNPTVPSLGAESGPAVDTDGDGLTDDEEKERGTNAATADSDGDGLTDVEEGGFGSGAANGTNPMLFDTDGDGVRDGDEVANGTDPRDPASS